MELKKYYTTGELAEMLGIQKRTVSLYIRQGKIKAVKIGQWKITKEAIEEYTGQKLD